VARERERKVARSVVGNNIVANQLGRLEKLKEKADMVQLEGEGYTNCCGIISLATAVIRARTMEKGTSE
jgi:hypothetical protein